MSTLITECALRSTSAQPTLLVIDDEPIVGYSFKRILSPDNVQVLTAPTGKEGLRLFREHSPDVVVLDYQLPDRTGLEVFREIHGADPRTPVLIITAHGTTDTAIEAMRLGAFDYLTKPVDYDRIRELLARAFEAVRLMEPPSLLPTADDNDRIIGHSTVMQDMCKLIGRVAPQDVTVLILGESGTGKELVARACISDPSGPTNRSSPSTAPHSPRTCSKANSSATKKAPSPAPTNGASASSSNATAARCSSTKSARCRPPCRPRCCACSRKSRSNASAAIEQVRTNVRMIAATNADLSRKVDAGDASARICSTGCGWSPSACRRCATAARTSRNWPPLPVPL